MAILERRRAAKWQKQVAVTVGEVQPSETLPDGTLFLFPYAQVQELTNVYLGKRKRTQAEKDKLLVELIKAHPRKEVAFASCAEALSESIVRDLLNSTFDVDAGSLCGLDGYLQAFVAAAHSKDGLFSYSDREFAASVIPVARDVINNQIGCSTAYTLFSAWRNGTPADRLLLSRVKLLTRKVGQYIDSNLKLRNGQSWWIRIRDYTKAVSLLKRTSAELEDCLHSTFPSWKCWANWTPNAARVRAWASVAHTSRFTFLSELDGPALKEHLNDGSEMQRLIRKGEMLQWLESKGVKLSPAFITSWSQEDLTNFILKLLETVIYALKKGPEYYDLLEVFIDSESLDAYPLRHWQSAILVVSREFVKAISTPSSHEVSIPTLCQGLTALSGENIDYIRRPLCTNIGKAINKAAEQTRLNFLTRFASGLDWAGDAEKLWMLRHSVAAANWIQPFLDRRLVNASRSQASKMALHRLAALHMSFKRITILAESHLDACLDAYVQSFVTDGVVTRDDTTTLPQVLHTLWICTEGDEYRRTAVVIAALSTMDLSEKCTYIRHLLGLPDNLVKDLRLRLIELPNRDESNLVSLTKSVLLLTRTYGSKAACWSNLLRWTFQEYDFSIHAPEFTSLGFDLYTEWIGSLYEIFTIGMEGVDSTYRWLSSLNEFEDAINLIEERSDSGHAMHFLLTRLESQEQSCFLKILGCFQNESNSTRLEFMFSIILITDFERGLSEALCEAILSISKVEDDGLSFCQKLLALQLEDRDTASWRLRVWLQMAWLDFSTEYALRNLAHLLDLTIHEGQEEPSPTAIENARDYYAKRVSELVSRVQMLEYSQKDLNKNDPEGVDSIITELDIERPTAAARLIVDLPSNLIDVVEERSDSVVELHFPLSSANSSAMERLAFGLEGTETLFVYLRVDKRHIIDACCVHLDTGDDHSSMAEHAFFEVTGSHGVPHRLHCSGKSTRLTYVVARRIWRELKDGERSLQEIYEAVDQSIHAGASYCMVCAKDLEVSLHRPTLCSEDCAFVYNRSDIDVRLEDLRVDSRVTDALLSSAFAAASTGKLELLPNRPSVFSDGSKVLEALNALPPTTSIDLATLKPEAEQLLSWTCNNYRGFVISATDRYKIPNMPNIEQFLLVDAPPEVEHAFAQHNELMPRHLLFHGTSMDRLYSVLAQGLRVLSGTALQKHGAIHGPGIYFAREPAFAMAFATKTAAMNDTASFFESRGDFKNVTVLLGCEHAGNDENTGLPAGMHLVTDPSRVMVRYIWIVPQGTKVPRAQDLRIPLLSAFNDLRLNAAKRTP